MLGDENNNSKPKSNQNVSFTRETDTVTGESSSVVKIPDTFVKNQIDTINKSLSSGENLKEAVKEGADKISDSIKKVGTEAAKSLGKASVAGAVGAKAFQTVFGATPGPIGVKASAAILTSAAAAATTYGAVDVVSKINDDSKLAKGLTEVIKSSPYYDPNRTPSPESFIQSV